MEVTKVKRLNELTTVEWTKPNGRHNEDGSLKDCPDQPHKEFLDQLATVEADLVARAKGRVTFKAAKAGTGRASENFTLTGISMTRNSAGRRQFSASAKADFGWGETGVSLPFLLEPDPEKPSTSDNVLSKQELANIEELFEQAQKYATGERHQATLDLEPGEDDPADPFDTGAEGESESEGEEAGEPALAGAGAAN